MQTDYTTNQTISKGFFVLKQSAIFLARILVVVILIRFLIFAPGKVHGTSMEPTFYTNGLFLVNKSFYLFSEPQRYQIVQLLDPEDTNRLLIKRIIGLPGEKLKFVKGNLVVTTLDGSKFELDENYLPLDKGDRRLPYYPTEMVIPEDSYYVLGDNRYTSRDSRAFGAVHRRFINGPIIAVTRGPKPKESFVLRDSIEEEKHAAAPSD